MDWLTLTILAIFSRAIYSIATKLFGITAKVSSITQTLIFTLCATLLTIIISPFVGGISFSGILAVWPVALVMIIGQAFGTVFYYKGMEKLDAGSTQIAFSSTLIWGTLLSVLFLNSNFSIEQIVGALLVMFAIILNAYKKNHKKLGLSVLYIVFCALLFAIFQVSSARLALTISTGAYLLMAYFGSAIIISLLYSKRVLSEIKDLKHNTVQVIGTAFFAGITSLGYFIFSYLAYAIAPSRGVVVLLLTTQVILSVILGIILLKERDRIKTKLVSAVIAVIGAILIKS